MLLQNPMACCSCSSRRPICSRRVYAVARSGLRSQVAFDLNLGSGGNLQQLLLTLQQATGFGSLQARRCQAVV